MVLMDVEAVPRFRVSVATASLPRNENEVSGDTISFFSTDDGRFYSLLSDGMGSGAVAKDTSEFVCKFLRPSLEIGAGKETLMHMLNHTVKSRPIECSATVDMLEIDLINGEASFIKSGAAPSFVKRENSIFRVRSQTAPIGLLSSIDTERTKVDLRHGDHVIMLSDGVADDSDDAPWLLVLLGEQPKEDLKEYADLILDGAQKNSQNRDDMSVIVLRVEEI
jgi:stage II sporulation protein E